MKTLGIIGNGFVGHAQARAWVEHVGRLAIYDIDYQRSPDTWEDVVATDVVMVCVPTPSTDYGLNTEAVSSVLSRLADSSYKGLVVIKSTVPVGYTAQVSTKHNALTICHSPEFLTARCAVTDAHVPSRNIVGQVDTIDTGKFYPFLKALEERFPGVETYCVPSQVSELTKLACNAFFATKIIFFNQLRQTLGSVSGGLDWWQYLLLCVLSDGRIAHSHTQVPGPDRQWGFGGTCLPKDLEQYTLLQHRQQIPHSITQTVQAANQILRGPDGQETKAEPRQ